MSQNGGDPPERLVAPPRDPMSTQTATKPQLTVNLNVDDVAAPAMQAALIAAQVVAAGLNAFDEGELIEPELKGDPVTYLFRGPALTSDQRRELYQNWLLSRGFQDLARGVRATLEEAASYLTLLAKHGQAATINQLQSAINQTRKRAAKLPFPELLATVNSRLKEPISFEGEFRSIQKVRNCLEHRRGIVGAQDIDKGGSELRLSFPRLKVFYHRADKEIEVVIGERVNAQDGEPEVQLLGRLETRTRTYKMGERITFAASDFYDIAAACHFFAKDVASKLGGITAAGPPTTDA